MHAHLDPGHLHSPTGHPHTSKLLQGATVVGRLRLKAFLAVSATCCKIAAEPLCGAGGH
jgi:hypothetical protein